MIAILLVAGYATRLYPLTKDTPKSLLPLGNKLIIDYIMDAIDEITDISSVVLVSNDKYYNKFIDWASLCNRENKAPITVLNDGTTDDSNKRGAIGDIIFAIDECKIDEDICVLAGDNIFTYSITEMYKFFKEKNAPTLVAIGVSETEQLRKLAVAQIAVDGQILSMEEKPSEPKSHWAIYATYFYGKEILPYFKEYIAKGNSKDAPGNFPSWLYKVIPVYAYRGAGTCIDIGTLENYTRICEEYKNKE